MINIFTIHQVWVVSLTLIPMQYHYQKYMLFPRKMIDAGFAYAAKHSLLRVNEIHNEEEAKLVLDESFSMKEEENEKHVQLQSIHVAAT